MLKSDSIIIQSNHNNNIWTSKKEHISTGCEF